MRNRVEYNSKASDSHSFVYSFHVCQMEGNTSANASFPSEDTGILHQYPVGPNGSTVMVASKIIVGSIGVVGNLLVVIVMIKHKELFANYGYHSFRYGD